jgi:hypothetical protein
VIVFECLALGALVCGGLLINCALCRYIGLGGFSFQTDKATVQYHWVIIHSS